MLRQVDGKLCRLYLVITKEQADAIQAYLDALLNLIGVDEHHEWMKENSVFSDIHELYAKIDEVESVIPWADAGTPLTRETRKQLFDLLDEYYENFIK